MTRSGRTTLAFVALLLGLTGSVTSRALAAPNDDQALELRKKAIEGDFLAADYAAAETKLGEALGICGGADCTNKVRARIRCDLGVVFFTQGKAKDARAAFKLALADDPEVTLDKDLASPPVVTAFADAKYEFESTEEKPAAVTPTETKPDKADCPPGFPGCEPMKEDGPIPEKPVAQSSSFVSLAFQQDFLLVPSAVDTCNGGNGYACFDGNQYYESVPLAGADNQVGSGVSAGTRRALLGYDFAVGANFLVGGRLGYAFSGGPKRPGGSTFFPLHVEIRGAWFLGSRPLASSGPKFFLGLGLGLAEYDAKVSVQAYDDRAAYQRGEAKTYDAWRKSGNGFASLGLGTLIALAPGQGIVIEAKYLQMLATSASGFGVQLGYTFGL